MTSDSPTHAIAANIRAERNRLGMTQSQLAQAIGVCIPAIVEMEKGRVSPPIDRLYRIADVLSISIYDLLPAVAAAA